MAFITLTTDFGRKDHFVSAVKGAIYTLLPETVVVDISHEISPFNINETAYILKNAYKSFPKGTIHIVGVDSELTPENKHIALLLDGHYFVCPDNGIMSMIASEINPSKIVEINIHDRVETHFSALDVFVNVACHIARGGTLDVIGKPLPEITKMVELQPQVVSETKIIGSVIYIDNYGNVISNITKELFHQVGKGRSFTLSSGRNTFKKIVDNYSDIVNFELPISKRNDAGNRLALFNSNDYLEIAIYKSNLQTVGGASSLLGLDYRSCISVEFDKTLTD
ncbi:S-adenosyl-l-methionine hydroxide adenosyltransferase family protein [Wenyingzhuangia sp. 2_MG-2023]|uniref:SAM hydrolase/SAM-dependent halogenase family protein n=1 Tax=Wenyingzhuangia sp. 2_MG-2023 TaxID=3062639 RepID=UPI0026E16B14|nr:SAM-dependent chlorinase/fluorinase [Wenyingzhuangia sp. 2_MG-2023]MDO6736889.1 SAM-dependent chlorinase/fluorinase [Wenyingzhuangia sp. 2_MG-2023]MDO6800825.1 SAM-dependent chlorinase/fluorinase [Wenyingzhuangia sp. 1_MG-2023]